jgi:ATP-dependent DNA helicase RecG
LSNTARSRLSIMRESTDGFEIAEKDLELRGAGELLGTRQTGDALLKIANLDRDQHLLPLAKDVAERLFNTTRPAADELIHRWLAGREKFANA